MTLDELESEVGRSPKSWTPEDVDKITAYYKEHAEQYPDFLESWELGANQISLRCQACDLFQSALIAVGDE